MTRKKITLEGLSCADCSYKIEEDVKNIDDIETVYLNFSTASLTIDLKSNADWSKIYEDIKQIVHRHDPSLQIIETAEDFPGLHVYSVKEKIFSKEYLIIVLGIILFSMSMIFTFSFPLHLVLFVIAYFLIGGKVLLRAGKNIFRGQVFDENFLMSIATLGAFAIGEYPEAVAVMLFYQIGEFFQDLAVHRSRKSIHDLMDIRPDYANLKVDEEITRVEPESVNINDLIVIKAGEKVPLDGIIIDGKSMMNTSALTGESKPRTVGVGNEILSGFINTNGLITLKVTKNFGESTVSKILELVENSSSNKADTEQFITKFSRYYTPIVVFSALMLALIPPLLLGTGFSQWIYRALIFLVISCPCALVISVPLGFFGGIGAASKNGVLVKGGNYLEALNNIDLLVFDKTGTLTKGTFDVVEIKAFNNFTQEELLKYAAYGEYYSNHPIAKSIVEKYAGFINKEDILNYTEIAGHGIKALVSEKEILLGNNRLMAQNGIHYTPSLEMGTIVHVAVGGNYGGQIIISDEIKEDAKATIQSLKTLGVRKTIMLTGDNKIVAENVAQELQLDAFYAQLLPQEKVEKLEALENEKIKGKKLAFVGDGINDAPVLARADIGIAMGGLGSDAAIEAADIVLMTDEPSKIVKAIRIAKFTRTIVLQNIVFALGVKFIVLILASFGMATMWWAVFADVGVALIAVLNSLRVLSNKRF